MASAIGEPSRKALGNLPKWKPSRNLLNARTRKLRNVFKTQFKPENFATEFEPVAATLFTGPLCDPIGYSQHGGECWSDTLQQLLFFSDGLKEHTQPYYYNTPFSEIEKKIDLFVEEDLALTVKKYVKAVQQRFISHYNLIVSGDTSFATCVLAPDYRNVLGKTEKHTLYRQRSLVMSVDAARSVVGYEKPTSGAEFYQFEKLYNILVQLSNADFSISLKEHSTLTGEETVFGYYMKSVTHKVDIELSQTDTTHVLNTRLGGGHAIGFLKCGGNYYFYDDNTGLFETRLPFSEIGNVIGVFLYKDVDTNKIQHALIGGTFGLKKVYETDTEKVNNLILMDGTIWNGVSWEKIANDYFDFKENSVMFSLGKTDRYALTKVHKRVYPIVPTSRVKPYVGTGFARGGTRRNAKKAVRPRK